MANHSWDNPQNEGQLRTTFSSLECITWLAVLCTIGIATVTVNGLAVIVYLKEPSLRKRSMYLVISLAIADLCIGGISLSKDAFDSGHKCNLWKSHLSSSGKRILIAVYWLFPVASVTNLAVISLERMHATFRPFKHRLVKKWIFGASAAFVWFPAVLNSSACMYVYAQSDLRKFSFAPLSILACCLCIILVSYSSIVVKMYCGTRPHHQGAGCRERKLTKTLFIVTVLSLALLLPYIVSFYFRTVLSSHLGMFFASLAYANSLVNPILYVYRIPEFKRAMSSFLGCRPRAQVFPQ
ncbi:substance-K receptor-like [Montipora capricornis]|uniref:substance-K receptor-like n=1 Tax=Montipora capricornis TaxID=246305 RepID=UPI0035F15A76